MCEYAETLQQLRSGARRAFCTVPFRMDTMRSTGKFRTLRFPQTRVGPATGQTGDTVLTGSLAFSPNKQLLAVGDGDEITLWGASTGRQLRTLKSGTSGSAPLEELLNRFVLAFSPDGKRL
jgi:WD40 repeat protein